MNTLNKELLYMANYYLPGYAGQIEAASVTDRDYDQRAPLYNLYSPRLFGAPPQFTNQCDMRLKSSLGTEPGPVGDWYLDNILRDAQICNFVIGHARFNGGFSSLSSIIKNTMNYARALSQYKIFNGSGAAITSTAKIQELIDQSNWKTAYEEALSDVSEQNIVGMTNGKTTTSRASTVSDEELNNQMASGGTESDGISGTSGNWDDMEDEPINTSADESTSMETNTGTNTETNTEPTGANEVVGASDESVITGDGESADNGEIAGISDASFTLDVSQIEGADTYLDQIAVMFETTGVFGGASALKESVKASWSMQQSFYTFEADWNSYINNVRMMINTAIIMLGLSDAKVRIGDTLYPINTTEKLSKTDVWSNYRFITATASNGGKGVGDVNAIDTLNGETNQYVSFMTEPVQIQESYSNQTGTSQIYGSVIQTGETLGNEIAFITNSSSNAIDDAMVSLAKSGINMAEKVLSSLTLGTGKFTAAILGSMARSFTGDHTIYPEIFTSHNSTSDVSLNIKLRASAGDPYTYLMDILVPIFHLMAMAIPQMSKSAASAYSYPPLIQLNIPGVWGTRLGIINSLSIQKQGNDYSVNGYPLAVDVSVSIKDLQHVIMSSGMNQKAQMLNNDTMFDYIAQCAGVDKYRMNPAIRMVTKLILAASAGENFFHNLGSAILNDASSIVNRFQSLQ